MGIFQETKAGLVRERERDGNGSGAVVRFGGERGEWERFIYLFKQKGNREVNKF